LTVDLSGRFQFAADCRHATLGLKNTVDNDIAETRNENKHRDRLGVGVAEHTTANVPRCEVTNVTRSAMSRYDERQMRASRLGHRSASE